MKTQKGVTLISVTIYVIVMLIVVSVITILTSYFYTNVDINSTSEDLNQQYTKFNAYFVEEINKKGNALIEINEMKYDSGAIQQRYIIFKSGNQYTYIPENKAIYMNKVKIAENITDCIMTTEQENGKTTISVTIKGENFERTTKYTLVG